MRFWQSVVALLAMSVATTVATAGGVELEVVVGSRAPFGSAQQWAQTLARLKSVRVRTTNRGVVRPDVKQVGGSTQIIGVIDGRNQLVVPGKRFSRGQLSVLQDWIDQQAGRGGKSGNAAGDDRFGLTTAQLRLAHELLKAPVVAETAGSSARTLVQAITRDASLRLRIDDAARSRLGTAGVVPDQWKGYSSGTALAAVLKPSGLVLVPAVERGQTVFRVKRKTDVKEGWPVGWPSKLSRSRLIPKWVETLPVEIYETPVTEVVAALVQRMETSAFYDHQKLKQYKVDPAKQRVTLNQKKTLYSTAMRHALFQAKLKSDVRVDEVGKAFVWITTSKK